MISRYIFCVLLVGLSASGRADDTIYLDETVISGNQELPRVLYVLPWQATRDKVMPESRPRINVGRVMSPIFPHEYRRELAYRNLLTELASSNSETEQITQESEED